MFLLAVLIPGCDSSNFHFSQCTLCISQISIDFIYLYDFIFVYYSFLGMYLFLLGYLICWDIPIHSSQYNTKYESLHFVVSVVMIPL